jgi:hypothetical protein
MEKRKDVKVVGLIEIRLKNLIDLSSFLFSPFLRVINYICADVLISQRSENDLFIIIPLPYFGREEFRFARWGGRGFR